MTARTKFRTTIKAEFAAQRGRPPSPETRAKLALPCCEKCRNLEVGPRGSVKCGEGHAELRLCSDFRDASRDRPAPVGGITQRVNA